MLHTLRCCDLHTLAINRQFVVQAALIANAHSIAEALLKALSSHAQPVQIWESGFISIPHTFDIQDLNNTLPKLLLPSSSGMPEVQQYDGAGAYGNNGDGNGSDETVYDIPSHSASAQGHGNSSGGRYSTGAMRSSHHYAREYTAARSLGPPRRGEDFLGTAAPRRVRHARVVVQPWLVKRAGAAKR